MKFNIVKEVGLCGDRSNENKKFRTQVSDRSANSNGQDFLILPPLPCNSSCCCHVFTSTSSSSNQIVVMQKISPAPTTTLAFPLTQARRTLHALDERGVKQRTSESEKGASHLEEGGEGGGGRGGARSVTRREIHAAVSFAPLLLLVFVLSAAPKKLGFNGQISSSHT